MILVAGRGTAAEHGLYLAVEQHGQWMTRQLDTVEQLAALASHPTLPVVYGLSGLDRGTLLTWDARDVPRGSQAPRLRSCDALGDIPCDLSVDPTGAVLVVASYGYEAGGGGSLAVWPLDERGVPIGEGRHVALAGSGSDPVRQSVPHPHQVVFHEGVLHVPDLGLDAVRRFAVRLNGAEILLEPLEPIQVPVGTGPRHIVLRGSNAATRLVVSGELSGELVAGTAAPAGAAGSETPWGTVPGSWRTGAATTRSERNYPGDVKLSADGRIAYFANRGYDTVAAIDVAGERPAILAERAALPWPQHLLVRERDLLVACWDGSAVLRAETDGGIPGELEFAFAVPGAGWLLPLPG